MAVKEADEEDGIEENVEEEEKENLVSRSAWQNSKVRSPGMSDFQNRPWRAT